MGALADFIRQEFGECLLTRKMKAAEAAISAIPASRPLPNSGNSENSSAPSIEFESPSRAPPASAISLEDRRASVEKIYERVAFEYGRRRDWWGQPVPGWPHRITLRNICRDETVVIDFQKWRAGR